MNQEEIMQMIVWLRDYGMGKVPVITKIAAMLESLSNQLTDCQRARDEHNNFMQRNTQVVTLYDSSAPSVQELIQGLRGELINCGCHASSGNECCCDCIWPEHVSRKAADLIEAQAAEIGVLKIAHEAHQTNNLKMVAVLKNQAAEIEKYKKLCDQMGNALQMMWDFTKHTATKRSKHDEH